jgi:hypothetical protein
MLDVEMTIESARHSASQARPVRIGLGLSLSVLLHILVALLVFVGWPSPMQPAPPTILSIAISVDLVRPGPEASVSAGRQIAVLPQEPAAIPNQAPSNPVPRPVSPPHAAFNSSRSGLASVQPAAVTPQKKPDHPLLGPGLKTSAPAAAKPKIARASADLQAQLDALAQQQQIQAQQEGQANSAMTFTGGEAVPDSSAAYRVKDFIRAQIERHWYLDRAATGAGDFPVSLHLQLQSDGRVMSAEIVGGASFAASNAYRSAASSLRAAALLSSPLSLPPGRYRDVKDIELIFRPKDVIQ